MLLNARFLPQAYNTFLYLFSKIYPRYKNKFESTFFQAFTLLSKIAIKVIINEILPRSSCKQEMKLQF